MVLVAVTVVSRALVVVDDFLLAQHNHELMDI
jgi:hypothetical protein